jgi:hypothetical protein
MVGGWGVGVLMRVVVWVGMALAGLVVTAGCVCIVCYEGDYLGRVIDAETREPLEGVVVLGVWYSIAPGPHGSQNYHDARETVTDAKGEFRIEGMGLKVLSMLDEMFVLVFKAGYEPIGSWPWAAFKEDGNLRKVVSWEGSRAIIPIRKMTEEEKRTATSRGGASVVPREKIPRLTEERERHSADLIRHREKK